MAKITFFALNFNDLQSPRNFPVSIDLKKKRFVKWSGTVLNLILNDPMKLFFINFMNQIKI